MLEHGAWADGSSWDGVVKRLQHDGYTVDVPPNPLRGVASDSAYLASYLATISGPIVLVGHSYGGFVTTNAATGNTNVKALVYVDAYIPAQGDTINSINAQFPGSQLAPTALNFVPSAGGVVDAYVKPAQFGTILGNDLSAKKDAELAATQRPIAASTLADVSGAPAWSEHSQLGRHRHRGPRDHTGRAGVHGQARPRQRHRDQGITPVADLAARQGRQRHRRRCPPHL